MFDKCVLSELESIGTIFDFDDVIHTILKPKLPVKKSRQKTKNRPRNRGYAVHEMSQLSDTSFTRMFRLDRKLFYSVLLPMIKPLVEPKSRGKLNAMNSSGSFISAETRLAVTLRWLAGGSHLDICFAFGIGTGSFYHEDGILWRTMAAIDSVLDLSFPLYDASVLKETSEGFSQFSHGRMKGCVMAVDGWVVKTRAPHAGTEVENATCFRNRKGFYGLVVMAGCDHRCRFTMWSTQSPGSTNDCIAWEFTKLYRDVIACNQLPPQYYFIGDEAFINTNNFLTPWSGHGIGVARDSFNFHLSVMRQCIERAFGILVRRWGIFWRPLSVGFERWRVVLRVCAKLHNLCIDGGIVHFTTDPLDVQVGDAMEVHTPGHNLPDDLREQLDSVGRARNDDARREQITAYLQRNCFLRPDYSRGNSKA